MVIDARECGSVRDLDAELQLSPITVLASSISESKTPVDMHVSKVWIGVILQF